MTDKKPLTPKQEAFAVGLASGMNQAQAYREAFPHSKKWKDAAVWPKASILAALDMVQVRVEELRAKAMEANEVTVERIVKELAKIAFADPRKVMTWGPNGVKLKSSEELTEDEAGLVSEVSESTSATGGSLKLKTHDKLGALKVLAEWKAMLTKKHELTGRDGQPLQSQASGVLVVPADMSIEDWKAAAQDLAIKQASQAKDGAH